MASHSTLTKNHIIENWSFANLTSRAAVGTYANADVGKIAYQQDDGSYWRLSAVTSPGAAATPTWAAIGVTKFDINRIVNLPAITGLTGGGASKLDGLAVTGLSFGQKVCLTINDADSFWTYQNGAVDNTKGDVAAPDGNRWRLTGGSGA